MKHKQILKMIEAVDPSDTETMDEINARVWCWLNGFVFMQFQGISRFYYNALNEEEKTAFKQITHNIDDTPKYTRSRDALKCIRPDGWGICHSPQGKFNTHIIVYCYQIGQKGYNTKGGLVLPTEELAELHAIIQAIAYERKVNNEE